MSLIQFGVHHEMNMFLKPSSAPSFEAVDKEFSVNNENFELIEIGQLFSAPEKTTIEKWAA